MPANSAIPDHFVTEFSTNWDYQVQQKLSRLKGFVTIDTINGKEKTYNQLAATSMRLITGRAAATTEQDTATAKRWCRQQGYDAVDLFDEFDDQLLGQIVLPASEIVMNHAMAYGRTCDAVVIAALGGTAYVGPTGVTATPLPVSQKINKDFTKADTTIAASGWGGNDGTSVGLTLDKVIKAKSIFGINEVDDDEEKVFVYSQQQLDDLLNNVIEIKSSDYTNVKALVDGTLTKWMGFTWKRSELLPLANNVRSCYAYAKSGVILSDAGRRVHMDIRADRNHALQVRSVASLGATRREEKKVVEIACAN